MTSKNLTLIDLLGKHVTFFVDLLGQKTVQRGVVSSVCLNLDGDHEILIGDSGCYYQLSRIQDLQVTGLPV